MKWQITFISREQPYHTVTEIEARTLIGLCDTLPTEIKNQGLKLNLVRGIVITELSDPNET